MKKTFRYNSNGVKSSSDMYRNINGIAYTHFTSCPDHFADIKKQAKRIGVKVRIIKDECFVDVNKVDLINIPS